MKRTSLYLCLMAMLLLASCDAIPALLPSAPTLDIHPLFVAATQTSQALATQAAQQSLTGIPSPTPTRVRPRTETPTPRPTFTPIPTSTFFLVPIVPTRIVPTSPSVPTTVPTSSICNWVAVQDITVEAGADFAPSEAFTKTWRFTNIGNCTWNKSYELAFSSGYQMDGPGIVNLPKNVAPGQSVDISIDLIAPAKVNNYIGYWVLKDDYGHTFGIGPSAKDPFTVEIDVLSYLPVSYHFARRYCEATWTSAAGTLPCPGTVGDSRGFIIKNEKPQLETGGIENEPALITHPQLTNNGYISGKFPAYTVQSGEHFYTVLSCKYGVTACDVIFRLNYQITGSNTTQSLSSWQVKYDDAITFVDINLTPLAGQSVQFILTVESNGSPSQDEAIWLAPIIKKP